MFSGCDAQNQLIGVGEDDIAPLLRTYWNVPERQIATSVVLSSPALASAVAKQLIVAERSTKVPN